MTELKSFPNTIEESFTKEQLNRSKVSPTGFYTKSQEITLTPEESHAIGDLTLSDQQRYYLWVAFLALRNKNLPLFYHECPTLVDAKTWTYKLHK